MGRHSKKFNAWPYVAVALATLALVVAVVMVAVAHADPYCGPGMNWDWVHQICQPGNPVPYPPYYPPNSPSPYPPYAGPTSIPDWH